MFTSFCGPNIFWPAGLNHLCRSINLLDWSSIVSIDISSSSASSLVCFRKSGLPKFERSASINHGDSGVFKQCEGPAGCNSVSQIICLTRLISSSEKFCFVRMADSARSALTISWPSRCSKKPESWYAAAIPMSSRSRAS